MESWNNKSYNKRIPWKSIITVLLMIQLLTAERLFSQSILDNQAQSPFKYALFTSPTDVGLVFYKKKYKPVKLTKEQFSLVQSIVKRISDSLNFVITSTNVNTGIVDTLKHVFQIVSAKNKKGQVYLWINAICDPNKDWRSRITFTDDGGDCYYSFKINLKTARYFDIRINANE